MDNVPVKLFAWAALGALLSVPVFGWLPLIGIGTVAVASASINKKLLR